MAITGLTQLWQPSEFPRSSVGWWWPWALDIIMCLIPMAFTFLRMTPQWTNQCVLIILGLGLTSEAFTNEPLCGMPHTTSQLLNGPPESKSNPKRENLGDPTVSAWWISATQPDTSPRPAELCPRWQVPVVFALNKIDLPESLSLHWTPLGKSSNMGFDYDLYNHEQWW